MILNLLEECMCNEFSNPQIFLFETDAQSFKIDYNIINPIKGNFPHVGITAREGICVLYFSPVEKTWLNLDVYTRRSPVEVLMSHMVEKGFKYQVMIYGPILSEIETLKIELPDDSHSKVINPDFNMEVSFFGGVHSFGIGCTTVGTMFSNILGRKLDLKTNQITFNNKDYLKYLYGFLTTEENIPYSNVGILELDYYNQDDVIVEEYLKDVVYLIKEHCDILIGWFSIHPNKNYKKDNIYAILNDEIKNNLLVIEDYSHLYNSNNYEMCTFGFHFINDAGNILIFKKLEKELGVLFDGISK